MWTLLLTRIGKGLVDLIWGLYVTLTEFQSQYDFEEGDTCMQSLKW